jgi:hypothetical protein
MIERDPLVRDHFLVLERRETFGDYAQAYGDAIAEHYEDRGVIVIPWMPIACDLDIVRSVTFPPRWKKIGSANGIERPVDESHPFMQHFRDPELARRLQAQIAAFNTQLRHGLSVLLPRYRSLRTLNITWRLLETVREGLHLDVFKRGLPLAPELKSTLRVKIFINIDLEPRHWRTSLDLPAILAACRGRLPDELPDDVNVVNDAIDRFGVLDDQPSHHVRYPPMSAVLVNAEVVSHEVVYGRRMVAGEFAVDAGDMLDRGKLSHASLRRWLEESGYTVAADAAAVHARHSHLKGSYQRIQEQLAAGN